MDSPAGPAGIVSSGVQLRTRLKGLGDALRLATADGSASISLGTEHAVSAFCVGSLGVTGENLEEKNQKWRDERDRAFAKARLDVGGRHYLRALSTEETSWVPAVAPFSIYPFDPLTCARLTCDYLSFFVTLGWEQLAHGFRRQGIEASNPMPAQTAPTEGEDPVMHVARGGRRMALNGHAMGQLLLEMVEPNTYAEAAAEMLAQPAGMSAGIFVFANERAIWK